MQSMSVSRRVQRTSHIQTSMMLSCKSVRRRLSPGNLWFRCRGSAHCPPVPQKESGSQNFPTHPDMFDGVHARILSDSCSLRSPTLQNSQPEAIMYTCSKSAASTTGPADLRYTQSAAQVKRTWASHACNPNYHSHGFCGK